MKVSIKTIREAPFDADICEHWTDLAIGDNVDFYADGPITGHFRLIYLDDKVLLRMEFRVTLVLCCSRCLEQYSDNLERHVDILLYPEAQQAEMLELDKHTADISFFHEDIIDINDYIREEILLYAPMKPLCSEDCQGLCHNCGTNLNVSTCQCSSTDYDPRWAILENLKDKLHI
jgi:uncharacterized protein